MTTPTHNSPQVAHTTNERANCATSGAIPAEDLAELRRISLSPVWLKNRELVCILMHLPALLAAYERDQEQQKRIAELEAALHNLLADSASFAPRDPAVGIVVAKSKFDQAKQALKGGAK